MVKVEYSQKVQGKYVCRTVLLGSSEGRRPCQRGCSEWRESPEPQSPSCLPGGGSTMFKIFLQETYLSPNTLLQIGDDRIFGQKFIISSQAEQPAELERMLVPSIYSFFSMCCIIVDCIYPLRMGCQWVKRTVRMQSGSCDRGKPDHKLHLNKE